MLNLLIGLLLAGSAQAGGIIQGGVSPAGVSPSSAAATYVNKAGDTMTGRLTAPDATLTYGLTAATGSFSGSVTASSASVTGDSHVMGNLGVGTNAPGARLHVKGSNAISLILEATPGASSDTNQLMWYGQLSGGLTWIDGVDIDGVADGTKARQFYSPSGAVRMTILDGGSVGIGTASPCSTCTLHVAGGASVTGAFDVGNGTFTVNAGYAAIGYGTTTPDARLGIKGTTNTMYLMYKGDNSEDVYIRGGKSTSDIYVGDTTSRSVILGKSGNYIESKGGFISQSRTIAQLLALSPDAQGQQFYCSDCSPKKIVVSTGTSAGNFAAADGGDFQ